MIKILPTKFSILLVAFLLWPDNKFAQLASENAVIINVSPLALTDIFDGPSVRIGTEINFGENNAVGLEGGTYLSYLKSTKINPEGYLIRPFVKRYLGAKHSGKYIALEYQYKNQDFGFRDSIVIDTGRIEKEYKLKRSMHSIVVKYGKLVNIKSFILDWYCGVGIRHIRAQSSLTPEEEDGILSGEAGDCPIQEDIIRLTGARIFPDFRAGIKIGYRFTKAIN